MNSNFKTPPRFVPTLTEVVSREQELAAEEEKMASEQVALPASLHELEDDFPAPAHSPWLADGLYARRGVVGIPKELPPLPEALPPQQPFSSTEASESEVLETDAEVHGALLHVVQDEADVNDPLGSDSEVVQNFEQEQGLSMPENDTQVWNAQASSLTEEHLIHRLMQRVDLVLEQRLSDAVAKVVQAQTRSMVLQLREEVESVVRQSVYEAVEDELAQVERHKIDSEKDAQY